jgi:hypothetical protein
MTTATRWGYSAGAKGRNRVRAFEGRSGVLYVEYWEREDGTEATRRRHSLGHRDRQRAKRQVDEIAARLAAADGSATGGPTLDLLFDNYGQEVTPRKGEHKQGHDRRAGRMFLAFFGHDRPAMSLNRWDWDAFIEARLTERAGPGTAHRPVGDRQIEYDLSWLRAVFRWATMAGPDGQPLLERNPLAGCQMPHERNPARPVITETQYQALRRGARQVGWWLELAIVLVNETGHRINAIRHVRWSDVDLERGRIRWRACHD